VTDQLLKTRSRITALAPVNMTNGFSAKAAMTEDRTTARNGSQRLTRSGLN